MKEREILKEVHLLYRRNPLVADVMSAYNSFIKEASNRFLLDTVDEYIILFVFNAWWVTDISQIDRISKWIRLYDMFDPLNRFDTAWEVFIDMWILTEDDYCDDNYPDFN